MALPVRKNLSHDVHQTPGQPVIVFITVCTRGRERWLASDENHELITDAWNSARAWLVGRYVILPDHIHLFVAPGEIDLPLENWVVYWKTLFTRAHKVPEHCWQPEFWDTRLRSGESYEDKWEYVRNNPVRHGLVGAAGDWPFQGELNALEW